MQEKVHQREKSQGIKQYLESINPIKLITTIKNQDVGNFIKILIDKLMKIMITIIGLIMIVVIPILLGYFIIKLWVYDSKGNLMNSTEIGYFVSLLSGYLGLLGSILGVIGAYYIFTKERRNLKKQSLDKLYSMISNSLEKTEYLMKDYVVDIDDYVIINKIYEGYLTNDNKNVFKKEYEQFSKIGGSSILGEVDGNAYKYICCKNAAEIDYVYYLKDIVYDEQWSEYLYYIDAEDNRVILKWINLIKNYEEIMVNAEKVEQTYSEKSGFKDLNSEEAMSIYNYYVEFINTRDDIIKIVNRSRKYKFKTLQQIHTERMDITMKWFLNDESLVYKYIKEKRRVI